MSRALHWLLMALTASCLWFSIGCQSCSKRKSLATLESVSGRVERDWANQLRQWAPALVGATFSMGDAVQTLESSAALLALDDGTQLQLEADTLVRFLNEAPGEGHGIDIETGGAELVASESAVSIRTTLGRATLAAGGRMLLRKHARGLRFEVKVGRAQFQDSAGSITELERNRGFVVEVGHAVFEKPAPPPAPSTQPALAAPSTEIPVDPALAVIGLGLDHADVVISAGESVVIHDPRPPTAVRFSFGGKCPAGGVVSLARGRKAQTTGRGGESVALSVPSGAFEYGLRCVGVENAAKIVAKGTLSVVLDAGTRAMPATAPATSVVADGRSYTVLYQNQPPKVSVSWPEAPAGAGCTLFHSYQGRTQSRAAGSSVTFPSGSLREGRHVIHFEGGGKLSRKTSIDIRFDNAAPKATLDTPAASGAGVGEGLVVSGIALPGWAVDVEGKQLERDAQGRFSTQARMPADHRALAVRLTHPQRGTHIYLRRAAGK